MQRLERGLVQAIAAATLATTLCACSTDVSWSDLNPSRKVVNMTRPAWLTFSGHQEDLTLAPVRQADLIGRDGRCAGGEASAASAPTPDGIAAPGLMQGGISLQMTECEVVNRAGAPDNIE